MNTLDEIDGMTPEIMGELQAACNRLVKGTRDPEAARLSRQRMAEAREEMRKRIGVQNIVVDLVRQIRDNS